MTAISHLLIILLSLMAVPQDDPASGKQDDPAAKAQENPAGQNPAGQQPEGPQNQPRIQIQQPGGQPVRAPRSIEKIKDYREGRDGCGYVRRFDDVRKLDLSSVDFDAPVLARVNGEDITRDEFLLWYAMNAGQNGILRSQLIILTEKAIERIKAEGGEANAEVTEADVDARIRQEEDMARAQGEEALATYKERVESTMGLDKYRAFVKAHLQSERILLPPIKKLEEGAENLNAGLPLEAAELLEDQKELRDYLNNSYLTGQELPQMFRAQFLRMLQQKFIQNADIKYGLEHDLPDGVYMTVEGESVTIDEILDFVPDQGEIKEGALLLCLLYRTIDEALADNDATLTPEEFEAIFKAHEAEFEGIFFPLPNLIALRGFYNMSEYREYYRRRAAYEKMMASTITDEELKQHFMGPGKLFYESGKADCSIFFVSLADTEKRTGLKGPAAWDAALERIKEAQTALLDGKTEEEVRAEYCSTHQGFPKGVTTPRMRNELRQTFLETEYLNFIHGYSLADDIFYNRVEGDLVGPTKIDLLPMPGMRENLGYILVQVKSFGKMGVLKDFVNQRPLIISDIYDLLFNYFGHECFRNSSVELVVEEKDGAEKDEG